MPGVIGKLLAMQGEIEAARDSVRQGTDAIREAGMLVEAAASMQTVAFVEIRAGDYAAPRPRFGTASRSSTASAIGAIAERQHSCSPTSWPGRGPARRRRELCADVRETVNDDDLIDVIAVDALEGFLTAAGR